MLCEAKGLYDQAIERRLMAMSLLKVDPAEIEAGREAYRLTGWGGYWRKEGKISEERAKRTYILPYNLARIYARLGDKERALMWLDETFKERSDHLVFLKVEPVFEVLRSEPRFVDLLKRVGLDS